jgi:CPA2 family monovalent cation:H+ antiporter-2
MQIQKLRASIRSQKETEGAVERADVELHKIVVKEGSYLHGKTIRETGFRERAASLVVGIERNNERILNPESDLVLLTEDVLFVVGNRKMLDKLRNNLKQNPT